jgi:hypothetical protein
MNKIIKEIAERDEQACCYNITNYEGFAKAIIQECIKSIGGYKKATNKRRKLILDHFGLTDQDLDNN